MAKKPPKASKPEAKNASAAPASAAPAAEGVQSAGPNGATAAPPTEGITAAPAAEPKPPASEPAKTSKAKAPKEVTLSHLYGYIDDDGAHRQWSAGQVVTDPEQIADLIARKAPLVEAAE